MRIGGSGFVIFNNDAIVHGAVTAVAGLESSVAIGPEAAR
jgi:hypothetical protein